MARTGRVRRPGAKRDFRPIFATAALAAAYWALASFSPLSVGTWQDDAIYVATAQSIAEGNGYRHSEIPGEPLQAKYPVLYPALLAAVMQLAPDFPGNVPWLLLPTALAAALFIALCALYAHRHLEVSAAQAWALALLAALAPEIVSMVRFTMSDLLYAALSVAAIGLLDGTDTEDGNRGPHPARVATVGALVVAAILTRSIGASLVVGCGGWLLLRRRWRDAAVFAAVCAVGLAPWLVRQLETAAINLAAYGDGPLGTLLASELGYAVWVPAGLRDTLEVVVQNVFRMAFGVLYFELAIPPEFAGQSLARFSWQTLYCLVLGFGILGLTGLGFLWSARRRVRALHVCAAVYFAMVLGYPGDPYRFLLPWVPFGLFFLLAGTRAALDGSVARLRSEARHRRPGALAAGIVYGLVFVLFALEAWRISASTPGDFHFRVNPQNWADARELEEELRRRTAAGDVIASGDFARLYLATGRQGYFVWPISDPYKIFYGRDRTWRNFYILGTPDAERRVQREVNENLVDAYRAGDVGWYVDSKRPDILSSSVRSFARAHPHWFQPQHLTENGFYRIYRVSLPGGR